MSFFRTNRHSSRNLILLILLALVFAPFVSAGTSVTGGAPQALFVESNANGLCDNMQSAEMLQSQQAASNCCDQGSDCKTHCQNLLLSHLPMSALLEPFAFQPPSLHSVRLSYSQILRGIYPPRDPRPPQI